MTLDLTEAEYLELRVAALSRIDLLTRAMNDAEFSVETNERHRRDLDALYRAADKLRGAYFDSLEVA